MFCSSSTSEPWPRLARSVSVCVGRVSPAAASTLAQMHSSCQGTAWQTKAIRHCSRQIKAATLVAEPCCLFCLVQRQVLGNAPE